MIFEKENRIFFYIKVTANVGHTGIIGMTSVHDKPAFKMHVNAVREKGRANQAIVAYLAEIFALPKSHILIDAGEAQPFKKIVILNKNRGEVRQVFLKLGFLV